MNVNGYQPKYDSNKKSVPPNTGSPVQRPPAIQVNIIINKGGV